MKQESVTLVSAMHISEGILSVPVLGGGAALTAAGTAIGLARLDYERIMQVAILSSAFFVASLIHVPIGPGSVHLLLNGLLGIILGWAAFPVILVALLLQAVFFQFGGLTVLGVNTLNMAAPAVLCHYLLRPLLVRPKTRALAGFLAGFASIFLSGLMMAAALAVSDSGFLATARLIVLAHVPVMVIEGIVTLFTVTFLARVQPELLGFDGKGGQ